MLLPRVKEAHHEYLKTRGAPSCAQHILTLSKLIEKIYKLVGEGITEVQEVKQALKHYVQHSSSKMEKGQS